MSVGFLILDDADVAAHFEDGKFYLRHALDAFLASSRLHDKRYEGFKELQALARKLRIDG